MATQLTNIDRIRIRILTDSAVFAGTDGNVYLSICGREFNLDTSSDDFEAGASTIYVLGQGANVLNPHNDPRDPQLYVEAADRFPVYLRFAPRSSADRWKISSAT